MAKYRKLKIELTAKQRASLEKSVRSGVGGAMEREIGDIDALKAEAAAWYRDRNHRQKGIDWQFTVGDARARLKHLYPVLKIKN